MCLVGRDARVAGNALTHLLQKVAENAGDQNVYGRGEGETGREDPLRSALDPVGQWKEGDVRRDMFH
jgi:hypothetical protein